MHDLSALQVKRHRTVSWGRVHCHTLIPLQSVGVDAGGRRFYANLASKDFAVPRCYSLWHANTTCTYLYSATSIPRLRRCQTFKSSQSWSIEFLHYDLTDTIRFYFQTLLSTLNIHFFTNTKFFLLQHVISNFVIKKKKKKTINKVETVSVLNCMLIKFHRIYEKHANIINWETGTGAWVVHTHKHALTHTHRSSSSYTECTLAFRQNLTTWELHKQAGRHQQGSNLQVFEVTFHRI